MSGTITLTLDCCDEFLNGKRATLHFTYHEADNEGYMGAYQPECYTLDAVTYGSGEYLNSLLPEEIKRYEQLRMDMERNDIAAAQVAEWEASLTDHYLAVTKGY